MKPNPQKKTRSGGTTKREFATFHTKDGTAVKVGFVLEGDTATLYVRAGKQYGDITFDLRVAQDLGHALGRAARDHLGHSNVMWKSPNVVASSMIRRAHKVVP